MRRSIKGGRVISVVRTYTDVALDVTDLEIIFRVANLRVDGQGPCSTFGTLDVIRMAHYVRLWCGVCRGIRMRSGRIRTNEQPGKWLGTND